MAKKSENTEVESAMDYAEHEKTYEAFLSMSKWTVIFCAALLIAMAFGFFGGGGLIGGSLAMIILMAIAWFAL